MSSFFRDGDGTYQTTARNILTAVKFFRDNPDSKIITGMWTQPTWTKAEFQKWLMDCLHAKTSNDTRPWRKLSKQYQNDLRHDARAINEYYGRRLRHTGCNGLLRTPELQARYPHVNRQV